MLTECQDCNWMEYIVWCLGLDTSVSMIVKWALSSLPQPDIVIWLKDCWKWHMQQTHNVDIKQWWYLGDTCIQNFYLGRYIVSYMVRNYILSLCWHVTLKWNFRPYKHRGAVKLNFRPYNRQYTSPKENFEYGYPHSDALFSIYSSKAQYFAPNVSFVSNVKPLHVPIKSDVRRCSDGISQKMLT